MLMCEETNVIIMVCFKEINLADIVNKMVRESEPKSGTRLSEMVMQQTTANDCHFNMQS